ncbi:hypothetical protein BJ742DRAFT_745408 [Cladochytrium replicatum]|nr:hypothetical protein BJ742DRAFT_745408 [Cladochytrium replicatum]
MIDQMEIFAHTEQKPSTTTLVSSNNEQFLDDAKPPQFDSDFDDHSLQEPTRRVRRLHVNPIASYKEWRIRRELKRAQSIATKEAERIAERERRIDEMSEQIAMRAVAGWIERERLRAERRLRAEAAAAAVAAKMEKRVVVFGLTAASESGKNVVGEDEIMHSICLDSPTESAHAGDPEDTLPRHKQSRAGGDLAEDKTHEMITGVGLDAEHGCVSEEPRLNWRLWIHKLRMGFR